MADATLIFLLRELAEILKGYKDLIAGAQYELDQLKDELDLLNASLKDIEKNRKEFELFKEMGKQIRDLVYKVADTIDACLIQVCGAKGTNACSRCLPLNSISLAQDVKSLRREKVKPALERYSAMSKSDDGRKPVEEPALQREKPIRENRLVDVKDEEQNMVKYLMEGKEELDVISIIGMPGLGKTTLAWKIYRNGQITKEFPTRIWIDVSQRLNSTGDAEKDVLFYVRQISSTKGTSRPQSYQELTNIVRSYLAKDKFLLVIDNVWSVDAWKTIKNVLPYDKGVGKVLITSRRKSVGVQANKNGIHMLRFFTEDESWELLRSEVFGNPKQCPQGSLSIGKLIAKLCDGVPLVIEVIGAILKEQEDWQKVSKNFGQYLQSDKAKSILTILRYSYNGLPDDLKECFLYIGVFPDHHEISAQTLTRLWIAEGFIHPDNRTGKCLEEIAHEKLDALIDRNLLLVKEKNHIGEVKKCRVHDMVRAFCGFVAQEQNLFLAIEGLNKGGLEHLRSGKQNLHRLCLHTGLNTFLSAKQDGPSVRSFLCFHKEPVKVRRENLSAIPDAFRLLRVLESKSITFPRFPEEVAKLLYLRYISLSIDVSDSLPKQISLLFNLQTLVVETKSDSITMKTNIWEMAQLRHVKTKAAIVLDYNKKGKGKARSENLQTLSRLSPQSCQGDGFKRACKLKSLGIRGKLDTLNFDTISLQNLNCLEKLKLMNDPLEELTSEYPLGSFPEPKCFPPSLKSLTLSRTRLHWEHHMPALAKIRNLEVLKLKDNAFVGISWKAVDECFGSLQFLLISNAELRDWDASAHHFPRLRCLVLKNVKQLKIPTALEKNLEKLNIDGLESAVNSTGAIEVEKEQAEEQQEIIEKNRRNRKRKNRRKDSRK